MYYKKNGFPEVGDILLCTVKKILPNSIFVTLDEYDNKDGIISIDEIAPGRIRNIRYYVKEGKKIVCKVLRVFRDSNHIDLSLRRVQLGIKMQKMEEIKQEERAEKILESVAKSIKVDVKEIYKNIGDKIIEKYKLLYPGLNDISQNKDIIANLSINKKYEEILIKIINERIKPQEIKVKAVISLRSDASDGVDKIKSVLNKIKDLASKNKYDIVLKYISAPKYNLTINSNDFKEAKKILETLTNEVTKLSKENNIKSLIIKNE